MRLSVFRKMMVVIPIGIICVALLLLPLTRHNSDISLGASVVKAGMSCFAWGSGGAPSTNNAPQSLCDSCKNQGLCAATGGPGNYWCGNCGGGAPKPPPNPDKPGINSGTACLGGTNRTVTLIPGANSSGATFQINMNPGNVSVAGQTYTFTNLTQGPGYVFQAQATTGAGSSGWSSWTAPSYQDTSPPTTTYTPVGTAGTNGWWRSNLSVTLLALDNGCLGVQQTLYALDGGAPTPYAGMPFAISGDGT